MVSLIIALAVAAQGTPAQPVADEDPVVCQRQQSEVGTHMRPKKVCMRKSDRAYVDQQEKQQSDYKAVVERAQEKSRTVECRRCGSDVNVACKNLTERKKGNEVDTVWPHEERLEDAGWDMAANWLEVTESTTVRPSE